MWDELLGLVIGFLVLAVLLGVYFLPTLVGYFMEKLPARMGVIVVVNLFLGWTVIGWVIAWILVITGRFKEPRHETD